MGKLRASVLAAAVFGMALGGPAAAAEKVVYDTDFNTMGDDGQAFVMLTQAMREARIELLGMSIVSGNQWLDQEVADALRAVERMGVQDEVKVYPGALHPLLHDRATLELEQQLFGKGYSGAWRKPQPRGQADLVAPPDGFAQAARPEPMHGVEFLVETIKANPNQVTILAVGPLTNIALAFRLHPEIVPLVKRIIYMGGAINVPGNVTPAAEFNWWFDPEAARIVLRQPIEHVIVPLDVTNTARFDEAVYDKVSAAGTPVARIFAEEYAETFGEGGDGLAELWDAVAAAYLIDPSLATEVRELAVDIDVTFGPNYGRSLGYAKNPPVGTQRAKVIFGIDLDRFFVLYADLLSRPVG